MRWRAWIPLAVVSGLAALGMGAEMPRLERRGEATQLIVDGKPFLVLGGEIFNSSSASLSFMHPLWPRLAALHLNTVLAPVSWAQFEPAEGKFDFTLVDGLLRDARAHNLRLVFLWFGSWKNSWSSYLPEWVKRNYERFPRVQLRNGTATERLTAFSEANRTADERAFAALMRRIKEVDGQAHTVLMIQVENEVGMVPEARDHCPAADAAYEKPAPPELLEYLQKHRETLHPKLRARWQAAGSKTAGTWEAVFGPGPETEDLFMAWHYARYIGQVAAAGKAEYNLPMFVNAALIRPGFAPGQFNSGGPLAHSMDIWKAGGGALDFLSPDIYLDFKKWCAEYDRPDNPLFIPEARGGAEGAGQAFLAIGRHSALGFSPFGIDWFGRPDKGDDQLAEGYATLAELAPLILENQAKGRVGAALADEPGPPQRIELAGYTLNVSATRVWRNGPTGPEYPEGTAVKTPHGIFIAAGQDEFYMAGQGLTIRFAPSPDGKLQAGIGAVEEGRFVDGRWIQGRVLAGDDTDQGNSVALRGGILRVTLYRYR